MVGFGKPFLALMMTERFFAMVPLPNVWHFFALSLLATLGNGVFSMLVWALVVDGIDYQEWVSGERSDGSIYSIFTFARKLGAAAASVIASYGLGWIGFVPGAAAQTPEVAGHIRTLYTAIPLITSLMIVTGIGLIDNLSEADSGRISRELAKRRDEAPRL